MMYVPFLENADELESKVHAAELLNVILFHHRLSSAAKLCASAHSAKCLPFPPGTLLMVKTQI
jgi:hypothetical protein